jgi:hypothetical protein
MVPRAPLRLVKLPEHFKGVFSNVYVCKDRSGCEFLFKEAKSQKVVLNELLAHRIAKVVGVSVLDFLERKSVEGKDGLVMTYLKGASLLAQYEKALNANQLRELQRIVVFDLLIGNRDRHSANVLVGKHLVAFDHGRVFVDKSAVGMKFVKLEVGRLLDKDYVDKLEKISAGEAVSTGDALVKWFGFRQEDFDAVKRVSDSELRRAIDSVECPQKVRDSACEYVFFRKKVFDSLSYC